MEGNMPNGNNQLLGRYIQLRYIQLCGYVCEFERKIKKVLSIKRQTLFSGLSPNDEKFVYVRARLQHGLPLGPHLLRQASQLGAW